MRVYRHWGSYRMLSMEPVGEWADDVPEPKSKRKRSKWKRRW
jgi:hypothetical protein